MKITKNRKLNKFITCRVAVILIMAQLILLMGSFTGCGSNVVDVPELKEPVSTVDPFRPVKKRTVGKVSYYKGQVVPTDHPVFATKGVNLSEIKVGVGDYVSEGDVVAVCSTKAKEEQITSIQNDIESLTRQRENTKNVSDETLKKLDFEKKVEEYLENTEGINQKTKDILIEQENQRFNLAVIDNQLSEKRSALAKLEEKTENYTFTAPCSGKVTFVKDVSKSNAIEAYENIVVISDMNDLYIETDEINLERFGKENYISKWTYIDGKRMDIVEHDYSNEEISYAASVKKNPPMAFDVPGASLTLGVDIMICCMTTDSTPKIVVGNDSINFDNGDYFVYIKKAQGENEKRIIELGETDGLYTEVKSGLSEGELVFYQNTVLIPKEYKTEVASLGDYREESNTDVVSMAYPYNKIYTAEVGGTYRKIQDVGNASGGDALFSIESSVGLAELQEVRDSIESLDNERTKAAREYQYKKNEIEDDLKGADLFGPKDMATDTDAVRKTLYHAEIKECELNILEYQEDYERREYAAKRAIKEADYEKLKKGTEKGDGRSDYVEYSDGRGYVNFLPYSDKMAVEKDSFVLTEQVRGNDNGKTKLLVYMKQDALSNPTNAKIGEKVTLRQEDKVWTGTCIGMNGNLSRYCLFTRDGRPRVTYSKPFEKNIQYQFYLEMDSEVSEMDLVKSSITFNGCDIRDVVVIPASALKTEIAALSKESKYYVWKVENEEIVKEYVEVYNPNAPTSVKYILNGVEPGDIVLK